MRFWRRRGACMVIGFGLWASVAAAQRPGPGRIAVAGQFPNGYVGLLARVGLPRDLLTDDALADASVVGRYDLLIVAGLGQRVDEVMLSFEAVWAKGGSVLVDYGPPPGMGDGARRGGFGGNGPFRINGFSNSAILVTPAGAGLALERTRYEPVNAMRMMSFVPALAEGEAVTLCEYEKSSTLRDFAARREMMRRGGRPPADTGPPAPAILLTERGRGKLIVCGLPIGMATSLGGVDFDDLVLGMVRLLTDGRAVPQLEPEGPRLARKESARSVGEESGQEPAGGEPTPDVPALPNGVGARGSVPDGFAVLEEEPSATFNIVGTMPAGAASVLLWYWSHADHARLDLDAAGWRATRVQPGRAKSERRVDQPLPSGATVTVKVRGGRVEVHAAGRAQAVELGSPHAGAVAAKGLGDAYCQPVESAWFTDDFMRTDDSNGGWETVGGEWHTAPVQNPDMGANPFSYKVEAEGRAVALQGYPFWDEYRFDAAVRPGDGDGWVGLGCYAQDAERMLLFRARVLDAAAPVADGFQLVRLDGERSETLATAPGGLVRGQWYQVRVKVEGPWLGAFVDESKVLVAQDRTWPGGKIALWTEGAAARFDDVVVEPVGAPSDRGQRLVARIPDYAGVMDLDSWAGPATPWDPDPDRAGFFWRRDVFFGDVGVRFDLPELAPGQEASLLVDGDGRRPESGYVVALRRTGAGAEMELRFEGRVVDRKTVGAGAPYSLAVRKRGDRVMGLLGEQTMLSTTVTKPRRGGRLAFEAKGFRPRISALTVWSTNVRDEAFDSAPWRWWVGSGEWDVTNRWSCTPDWSWFGGYSRDVAAIWYKPALAGDVLLDFYAGPKMMDESFGAKERVGDFNAVLCGDGRSVDSGYAFVVGPEEGGASILREGRVVARNDRFRIFRRGHNRWANVRAEKRGPLVALYFDDQPVLSYEDPQPLEGGYVGVWTRRNGIMLPRITICYERLGEGRLGSFPAR